ncbi:hypothetical protein AVEN_19183-1 [Araneus ventricosus]|uniref:DUF4817 domain-containing protein n=1 Tax=Araneus ventricosus TaxID=182803 RepID=A0A4Y2SSQ3_ARAVE|nr:hypothetical protein AVEN_19183-1 [Araneus ventricosus]
MYYQSYYLTKETFQRSSRPRLNFRKCVTPTILNVVKRVRETGCVTSLPRVRRPRNVRREVQTEDVLAYALAHPQSSTNMIDENCGLSKSRVWTILNESGAHADRSTPTQGLLPRDSERRYTWCNFVMNKLEDHPTFLVYIIWTDEARFSRNGIFNRQSVLNAGKSEIC